MEKRKRMGTKTVKSRISEERRKMKNEMVLCGDDFQGKDCIFLDVTMQHLEMKMKIKVIVTMMERVLMG